MAVNMKVMFAKYMYYLLLLAALNLSQLKWISQYLGHQKLKISQPSYFLKIFIHAKFQL